MYRTQLGIQHEQDRSRYKITIYIPDDVVPYHVMKNRIMCPSFGLSALDFARELFEKEAYWYYCPTWDLDYGIET